MTRSIRKAALVILVSLFLSALFLWLALRQVEPKLVIRALVDLQLASLVFAGFAIALGILLRGWRWRLLSGSANNTQPEFFRATALGVFANLVIPARLGEIVRVAALYKLSYLSLSEVVASGFVDRLTDILVLVCVASVLFLVMPIPDFVDDWLFGFGLALGLVMTGVALTSRRHVLGRFTVTRVVKFWRIRWPAQPLTFAANVRHRLSVALRRVPSPRVAAVIFLVLIADYCAVALVLRAFRLDLPLSAPLVLWVFFAAGSALPSAPGYVGVYQLAGRWALGLFDVPATIAVALATVFQAVVLLVAAILAGMASWRTGVSGFYAAESKPNETKH
ncbi:lysylphosphatidylglycerol synthase transmembrane domain-containing protein [Thiorhodovibrio frisius]|uniref:Putative integral membrane protein n=1 Tax=Thiorhodovibrio frisius TaxID=631362 RepID=H8Z1S4_9GAMM|nr:lysylphosphatidylglycerol synthase transmembrane domain-containing protein [Thiorhodovibrio frisius]EIC22552.1 putative integral membrane protein [Thiorhodovibrio frisius]WPL19993.1 hypothetical protein Thiofri_00044 [Thiorhodovibrio frisius]